MVLLPVLNRPQNAEPVAETIRATSDARILFICSRGDRGQVAECKRLAKKIDDLVVLVVSWEPGPGDYARKINFAFGLTEDEWVFTGADDLRFHDGWLFAALSVAAQKNARVVGTNDMCNPMTMRGGHSTHTLVARSYVDELGGGWDGPGIVLHEGYDHQCVDNELVTAAKQRHEWAHCRMSRVQHLHPLCEKIARDATYTKALAHGQEDIALFRQRLQASRG